jgi:DNA-binding transcriptional ArsR family regulator
MSADSRNRPAEGSRLPGEIVEDILSSERRRALLSCLVDCGEAMAVEDLAAAVRARERGVAVDVVDAEDRRAVREDIYERHLPKLTATGVVEYDSMHGTVRLSNRRVGRRLG